jgi:ribosomal protein S18 acetylase RimI-like enzyme
LTKISIRQASTTDAELLASLGARTFSDTFAADNTAENMAEYLGASFNAATQEAELSSPGTIVKLAEIDGAAVGYSMLGTGKNPDEITGENPIELVRLYVSNDFIGKGVGAALMKDCIEQARNLGYQTIWLGVWEHNHRAQAFYRKWKFVAVGTHIFQLGDDAQTDLLMQRDLTTGG